MKINNHNVFFSVLLYTALTGLLVSAYFYNDVLVQSNKLQYISEKFGNYDYGVESANTVAMSLVAILVMIITAHIFLRKSKKQKRENIRLLTVPGTILLFANVICLSDVVLSSWSVPQRCGSGFDTGNCLLFDGLGMMIYYVSVPVFYLVAIGLLTVNYTKRNSVPKHKSKQ